MEEKKKVCWEVRFMRWCIDRNMGWFFIVTCLVGFVLLLGGFAAVTICVCQSKFVTQFIEKNFFVFGCILFLGAIAVGWKGWEIMIRDVDRFSGIPEEKGGAKQS